MPNPFLNLTLTANDQTVTASFTTPGDWNKVRAYGNSDFATNSNFTQNVTSSNSHPGQGTTGIATTTGDIIVGTNLTPSTTYYYRVRHAAASGYSSYLSGQVTTGAASISAPNAPGAPSFSSITTGGFTLSWSAVSSATSYKVYLGTSSSPTNLATTVSPTTSTHTGLNSNETYYARLKATNSGGDSGYGSQASATTLPPTPTNLSAAQGSSEGEIDLSWDQTVGSGDLTVTYTIERSTSSGGTFVSAAGNIASGTTSFTDNGLDATTTYYYRIFSTTSAGNSPVSSEASATTSAATAPNPTNELLELGKLNVLVGRGNDGATVSINDVTGDTNEASFKDFFVGGFTSISGNNLIHNVTNTSQITANFSNAGERFKTKVDTGRFSWSITDGSTYGTITSTSGRTCIVTHTGNGTAFIAYNINIQCVWTPVFNDHLSQTTKTLTITAIKYS